MNTTPSSYYSAPEVVPHEGLHHNDKGTDGIESYGTPLAPPYYNELVNPERGRSRICGYRRRTFWITLSIAAVVIIGAAVGGGIGGSIAVQPKVSEKSPSAGESSSSSASASKASAALASTDLLSTSTSTSSSLSQKISSKASTTLSSSITTTAVVGPTKTLYRDCPSSENTLYGVTLGDETYNFRKFCNTVMVTVGANVVSVPANDLNSCINQCAEYNFHNNSTGCNSVCWWNTFDAPTAGQCWGFPTQNSSSGFQFEVQPICDAAGLINAP